MTDLTDLIQRFTKEVLLRTRPRSVCVFSAMGRVTSRTKGERDGAPERDVNVTFRPLQDLILPHKTAVCHMRNSLYVIHLAFFWL